MSVSVEQKAVKFVALHERNNVFPIPNPWDIGSARILQALGFEALATTSSGLAQSLGRLDGMISLDEAMRHCEELAAATTIPITADLENGFGRSPGEVAACIRRVAETGVVGASIEDFSGDDSQPIYEFGLAVERIEAAVEAARTCPFPFTLTARAEQLLRANYDLEETIRRLQAYEAAGADVLYAPALKTVDDIRAVAQALDKPVNVLGSFFPDNSVAELGCAGATRVSIGGGLARLSASVTIKAAQALHDGGDLGWMRDITPGDEIDRLLGSGDDVPD